MEWSFSDWTRNRMDFFCLIPNYIFSLIPKRSSVPWTRNRIGSCPLGGILKHFSSQDNFILILGSLSSHEKIHSRVLLVPLPQQFPSFGAFILMTIYYWGNFYPQASFVLVEFKKFGSNAKISCAHFFIIFNHACIYNKYAINIYLLKFSHSITTNYIFLIGQNKDQFITKSKSKFKTLN